MYPVQDRNKPCGMLPGMIKGHAALNPDGTMKAGPCLELQETLISHYKTEEFQKKLYAGWYATDDLSQRHKWRQHVCLTIQRDVLPQFGFEGTRAGVFASGLSCNTSRDIQGSALQVDIGQNGFMMDWLVNPDKQESGKAASWEAAMCNWFTYRTAKEGDTSSSDYQVCLTDSDDTETILNIARMQGVLAAAHHTAYQDVIPDGDPLDWFNVLGMHSNMQDCVDRGDIVYHAKALDTGRVVGYISCKVCYGDSSAKQQDLESNTPHASIGHIVVLNQHRGRGVGNSLFLELLQHLHVACSSVEGDIRISVAERNSRAKAWYQRLGFVPIEDWLSTIGRVQVKFIKMQRRLESSDFDDMFA